MDVLVISAHPDDETLGCGGTIFAHRAAGDAVDWLILTKACPPRWSPEVVTDKEREVDAVSRAYGMRRVRWLPFTPAALDRAPEADLIEAVRERIVELRPAVVYVVHEGDVHSDHRATFGATMAVLKAMYMTTLGVRRVLSYEVLSSTEAASPHHARAFVPTVYREIGAALLEQKVQVMELYRSETQGPLMPRAASSIRALARYRGATVGVEYAEAFQLLREVEPR